MFYWENLLWMGKNRKILQCCLRISILVDEINAYDKRIRKPEIIHYAVLYGKGGLL